MSHIKNYRKLNFIEWLKKKPNDDNWNHYEITYEWALYLINLINKQDKLHLKTPEHIFVKKFQHFLYKRSSTNINKFKYYYK